MKTFLMLFVALCAASARAADGPAHLRPPPTPYLGGLVPQLEKDAEKATYVPYVCSV